MKNFAFITGLLMLFAAEILRVYFIMPFPGSQEADTIDIAYFIARNIWWFRIAGLLLIAYPAVVFFDRSGAWKRAGLVLLLMLYGAVVYLVNFSMEADKMFYQPGYKHFATGAANTIGAHKLVLGVTVNGVSKAYPIQLIGYHHQVADTVGNQPVMVTYCTVCRTGRVYNPDVNGKMELFRLVGMDHFNAMFEDATTRSWWQQATGVAIAGALKGKQLAEIPSEQMSLAAWLRKYPASQVMQPDSTFKEKYEKMDSYEKGLSKSKLTKRDASSWNAKSWVLGLQQGAVSRAYDWNQLVRTKIIEDSLPGLPLMIILEKDSTSFHAYNRSLNGQNLHFTKDTTELWKDIATGSVWNADGKSISGPLKGAQLHSVQVYQEFWHSWQTFHPGTGRYQRNSR